MLTDSPGIFTRNTINGNVLEAAIVTWTFTLYVSVTSGGQTANCPPISWQAWEVIGSTTSNNTITYSRVGGVGANNP
jgi:hypothetical protein